MISNKHEFRKQMKRQRQSMEDAIRGMQNASILQRLFAEPVFLQAHTIFCYCSTKYEIDTYPILQYSLAHGKCLCVPRVSGDGQMDACQITALEQLQPAAYGVLEPEHFCPIMEPEQIDLCIIPCLAADYRGYRLGYGGGYYDRFLTRTHAMRLVLCIQAHLFPSIPSQEHDIACDMILTESQVIRCHEK